MNCPSHHTLIYVSVDWFCCVCFCLAFQWFFWDVFPGGVDWNPSCTDVVVELHFVGWCLGVHTCIMYRYIYICTVNIYIYLIWRIYSIQIHVYICIPFEIISTYRIYPSCTHAGWWFFEILPFHRGKAQCKATQDCRGGRGDEAMMILEEFFDIFPPENSYVPKISQKFERWKFHISFYWNGPFLGGGLC